MEAHTRRDVLKWTSATASLAIVGRDKAAAALPTEISIWTTSAEHKFARQPSIQWSQGTEGPTTDGISLDSSATFQQILGFGAALTDSACYTLSRLPDAGRRKLLDELFGRDRIGLQVCRICIGASDYARKVYSYDEGESDPDLKRFSIDHDKEYILPTLRSIREVNPDLFLLASPWSPPGWMKPNRSMLGGCIHPMSFPAYARYFGKFLQSYAAAGVPVQAVSVQNEVDTEQDGRMPACLFSQEHEVGFVTGHLGPELRKSGLNTKIWILDHNYNLWGRAICELEDNQLRDIVDGVAWHGYVGAPSAMTRVHQAFPDKHMYWTEGGPDVTDPHYATDWAQWGTTFAGILNNWARCIIAWNLALDEAGKPNIGPFTCGGVVTVDSASHEISRSGQYWALAHYAQAFRPGSVRIHSAATLDGVSQVAAKNPDGSTALVLSNIGPEREIAVRMHESQTKVKVPADSIVTLKWS